VPRALTNEAATASPEMTLETAALDHDDLGHANGPWGE
jgi:hypothetical protein